VSQAYVNERIDEHAALVDAYRALAPQIAAAGDELVAALRAGSKVLLCGNGGSAGDAQHIAAELTGRFETNGRGLPGIALTTDSSAMTAISNDFGYAQVFARQVQALGKPGDVLIGISTSGTSGNVVAAVEAARDHGLRTIGLAGKDGGSLATICDHCVTVPSANTARVQEYHILTGHIWCGMVDRELRP
jgi:phosphoheptose isomerase